MAAAHSRLRDRKAPERAGTSVRAASGAPARACPEGNQARLRAAGTRCAACERRHDRQAPAHGRQEGSAPPKGAAAGAGVDVWGFRVDASMCRCRPNVREEIDWNNEAAATYRKCNTPANNNSVKVEACFKAAHPHSVESASTSASGAMDLPAPSADPCDRLLHRKSRVHEIMHSRQADAIARNQGPAFFRAWQGLAGKEDRINRLLDTMPGPAIAFVDQWTDGDDWAKGEIQSYTWARRFLQAALTALDRICP